MRDSLRFLFTWAEGAFSVAETPVRERRQRAYYAVSVGALLLALLGVGVADVLDNRGGEALSNLAFVAMMSASLVYLRLGGSLKGIARFGFGLGQVTLVYEVTTKLDDALVLQWLIVQPIAVFFLLGAREGAFWVVSGGTIATVLLLDLTGSHAYDPAFLPVFLSSFLALSVIGYLLEASRRRLIAEVQAETANLERTLAMEETLQDLIPICAQCKSVRDDDGYWHRIEAYLGDHTTAALESAMCPSCVEGAMPRGV
ncbi:MAG: hypothetical protein AAGM22_05845 [Acidobacteriota bacterium]